MSEVTLLSKNEQTKQLITKLARKVATQGIVLSGYKWLITEDLVNHCTESSNQDFTSAFKQRKLKINSMFIREKTFLEDKLGQILQEMELLNIGEGSYLEPVEPAQNQTMSTQCLELITFCAYLFKNKDVADDTPIPVITDEEKTHLVREHIAMIRPLSIALSKRQEAFRLLYLEEVYKA